MNWQFEKYKGIHPGIVLDRELKKRSRKQRPFVMSIGRSNDKLVLQVFYLPMLFNNPALVFNLI